MSRIAHLENEAVAVRDNIRTSTRKLDMVAALIRGMRAADALTTLTFCKKRVAIEVKKALKSAIANAENNNSLDVDSLYVQEAYVGKSIKMRRFRPQAKGRAAPIIKMFSRLTIVVAERELN